MVCPRSADMRFLLLEDVSDVIRLPRGPAALGAYVRALFA